MSKKILFRWGIFLVIIIILLGYLSLVFTFPRGETSDMARERFNTFYDQPEGTVDAVYIGSSGVDRYWIPSMAWENLGITVYDFTSGNQPLVFAKYMMEEAARHQDIKLFILEIRGAMRGPDNINDTDVRRVTDNLRPSLNKIKATREVLSYIEQGDSNNVDTKDLSYFFSLAKYHSKWNADFTLKDLVDLFPKTEYMGYFAYNNVIFKTREQKKPVITKEIKAIPEENQEILLDLLDYCKSLDTQILFVSSPQVLNTEEQKEFNYVMDVIEKNGFDTLNFNSEKMYNELQWDFKTDMYNSGHANINGALKYTDYLGKHLKEKYHLEDHRNEESKYRQWDEAQEALLDRIKDKKPELYQELISLK